MSRVARPVACRSNEWFLSISSHLARHGIGVTVVFEKVDALLAYPIQLPECVRKSRYVSGVLGLHLLTTRLQGVLGYSRHISSYEPLSSELPCGVVEVDPE